MKFKINVEELKKINNDIVVNTFFNYIKNISRNKTTLTLHFTPLDNYYKLDCYECNTPTSSFESINIPFEDDKEEFYLKLNNKLVNMLQDNTTFEIKDSNIIVDTGVVKVIDTYDDTSENIKTNLTNFLDVLKLKDDETNDLEITKNSEFYRILQAVSHLPTSSASIEDGKLTFRDDSFLFRTNFVSTNKPIFINNYLASKILDMLKDCDKVVCKISYVFRLEGYINEFEKPLITNVSSIFEAPDENPTDEDIQSIYPDNVVSAEVSLEELIDSFDEAKSKIRSFIDSDKDKVFLYKNGEGLSFMLSSNLTDAKIIINVGDVEKRNISKKDFTDYKIYLPLSTIMNVVGGNAVIKFIWDDNEDKAVGLEVSNYKMLTGKSY